MNSALSHADRIKTSFSSLYLSGLHAHLHLSFPSGGRSNTEYVLLYSVKNKRGQ